MNKLNVVLIVLLFLILAVMFGLISVNTDKIGGIIPVDWLILKGVIIGSKS